jgi:selenophosphate synthetase-related protein
MGKRKQYLVMDGRARFDQDRAIVCEVCDSLKEAKSVVRNYGDAVVVDSETNEIVYDPN